jgi:hypothetical protein
VSPVQPLAATALRGTRAPLLRRRRRPQLPFVQLAGSARREPRRAPTAAPATCVHRRGRRTAQWWCAASAPIASAARLCASAATPATRARQHRQARLPRRRYVRQARSASLARRHAATAAPAMCAQLRARHLPRQ